MTGIFDGMGEASSSRDSNYVIPAHVLGRINRVKSGTTRKEEGFFAVEMTVVHDCSPDKYERGKYGHMQGEEVTWMAMAKHDSFLSNVKQFVGSTLAMEDEAIGKDEVNTICGDDQPLAGLVVEVVARNIITRANKDFTKVSFKGEVAQEEVAKLIGDEAMARFFPGGKTPAAEDGQF
jgi:hypothetical protein